MANRSTNIVLVLLAMFSAETSHAEDPFQENRADREEMKFTAFEEANQDLESSVTTIEPAPADLVAEQTIAKPKRGRVKLELPKVAHSPAVVRVERNALIERLTLKNGDTVINVRRGADPEQAMRAALGVEDEREEAPIKPTEDWANLP